MVGQHLYCKNCLKNTLHAEAADGLLACSKCKWVRQKNGRYAKPTEIPTEAENKKLIEERLEQEGARIRAELEVLESRENAETLAIVKIGRAHV